jgi:hypothetical protein
MTHEHDDHSENYIEGGKIDYESLERDRIPEEDEYKGSMITDQAMETDY